MTQFTLNGDVHGPEGGQEFLQSIAGTLEAIASTDEQSAANLAREGVTGPAVDLAHAMAAASSAAAAAVRARIGRYAGHIADRDQHISDDLAGTQSGKYLDPAAQ